MIIGIGTDIVNISRIEEAISKHGDLFLNRCFTPKEIAESINKPDKGTFFAKRFAVKEAFFKAIGTGFQEGVSWQDVEKSNYENGKPKIEISGKSKEILDKISKNTKIHLTISDDKPFATATVIIEEI